MGVVYKITNLVNGKIYVGQTRFTAASRWRDHKANANRGLENYLYRAMRKYEIMNFSMEVLEENVLDCDLNSAEIKWIEREDGANPKRGYNATYGGEGGFHGPLSKTHLKGVRKHTLEARAKMSAALKGRPLTLLQVEARKKAGIASRGSHLSEEAKRKIGEKNRAGWTPERRAAASVVAKERFSPYNQKGKVLSEETKAKLRGRIVSEETRKKLSNQKLNMTDEYRAKLSAVARERAASMTPTERTAKARRAAMALAEKTRGVPRSPEVRKNIGDAQRGRKATSEEAARLRTVNIGRKQTSEEIAKRSESNRQTWAKKSVEERLEHGRNSVSLRSPWTEERKATVAGKNRGTIRSEESKRKMSESAKRRWKIQKHQLAQAA